jgi:hypothetical protein
MHKLKSDQNLIFLLFTAVLAFIFVHEAGAFIRPANPVMDYVPQNVGIYDTYYENLKENDCRVCHGSSTAERHHDTQNAHSHNCLYCHYNGMIAEAERDCKVCHVDGGPFGDFGNPHHRSDLADSSQCNQCHLHVVETNTVEPPNHVPNSTTPTPYSCENCHWSSGSMPHEPATYDGNKSKFLKDWLLWTASPKPTYWLNGIPNPQPIEANGIFRSGLLYPGKPYIPLLGTHHKAGGKVFQKCYNCHASASYNNPDWNPDNPYLIRMCENCHSMDSLHSIKEHITTNTIYTVGGLLNQTVTATEKCMACHSGNLPIGLPDITATIPVIDRIEPNFGPPGTVVNIIPASGQCWDEDPVNGLCSFGLKMTGDKVIMAQKDKLGNWYWVNVPINSWSEHLIQINVPGWPFQSGKIIIKVYKENIGMSAFKVFTVTKNPVIHSLTPSVGNWGQDVIVGGDGFSVKKERVYGNGYGYSVYIELHFLDDKYRVTKYSRQESWDPNMVLIRLTDLLDINTGNPVLEQELYPGCWNVKIITDYFKDDPINGTPGKYNLGLDGLDPADELLYRVTSNPICFTVTKDPYINGVRPNMILDGNTFVIYGANFGSSQGTSFIRIGKDSWLLEIIGDGIGNDDGKCTKDEYKNNGCTLDPAKAKILKVVGWSNTMIKCKLPTIANTATLPLRVHVQVEVEGRTKSNCYPFTIIEPGS